MLKTREDMERYLDTVCKDNTIRYKINNDKLNNKEYWKNFNKQIHRFASEEKDMDLEKYLNWCYKNNVNEVSLDENKYIEKEIKYEDLLY